MNRTGILIGMLAVIALGAGAAAFQFRALSRTYEGELLKAREHIADVESRRAKVQTIREVLPPRPDNATEARVRDLEQQLAARDAEIASLRAVTSTVVMAPMPTNMPSRDDRPWRDGGDWLASLRTNDPVRYAEITNRQAEARARMQRSFAEKAAAFLERDTTALSDLEKAQYEQMISVLTETWKLSEQLRPDMTRDERRPIVDQLRDNMRTLSPLLEAERNRQLREMGRSIGYSENQAEEFVAYVNQLLDLTSMRPIMEAMRGGGGGWGGGPPPGR